MGSNLLVVMSGTTTAGGAHGGFGTQPTLTWDDMAAIQREVSSVQYVAPQLRTNAQVITEEQNWTTSVTGTTAEYFFVRSWPLASGAIRSCFMMTEPAPGSGSDPSMLLTTAKRDAPGNSGDFVIDGTKWLITGAIGDALPILCGQVDGRPDQDPRGHSGRRG
jgi:alkylation response protein AidB-like acyl-CoA dehydrogenase